MKKGPEYEKFVLEKYLQTVWPEAERYGNTQGSIDKGDYRNIGDWIIDAKKRDAWALAEWVRNIMQKAGPLRPWAIVFARDKRSGVPDLVCVPADQYFRQVQALTRLLAKEGL